MHCQMHSPHQTKYAPCPSTDKQTCTSCTITAHAFATTPAIQHSCAHSMACMIWQQMPIHCRCHSLYVPLTKTATQPVTQVILHINCNRSWQQWVPKTYTNTCTAAAVTRPAATWTRIILACHVPAVLQMHGESSTSVVPGLMSTPCPSKYCA